MSTNMMGRRDDEKRDGLPIIRCVCGTEILVVPSITRMNEAIENHSQMHKRRLKGSKKAKDAEAKLIREFLCEQMFTHIIKRA